MLRSHFDTLLVLVAFLATLAAFVFSNDSDGLKDLLLLLGGAVAGVAGTKRVVQ